MSKQQIETMEKLAEKVRDFLDDIKDENQSRTSRLLFILSALPDDKIEGLGLLTLAKYFLLQESEGLPARVDVIDYVA